MIVLYHLNRCDVWLKWKGLEMTGKPNEDQSQTVLAASPNSEMSGGGNNVRCSNDDYSDWNYNPFHQEISPIKK